MPTDRSVVAASLPRSVPCRAELDDNCIFSRRQASMTSVPRHRPIIADRVSVGASASISIETLDARPGPARPGVVQLGVGHSPSQSGHKSVIRRRRGHAARPSAPEAVIDHRRPRSHHARPHIHPCWQCARAWPVGEIICRQSTELLSRCSRRRQRRSRVDKFMCQVDPLQARPPAVHSLIATYLTF